MEYKHTCDVMKDSEVGRFVNLRGWVYRARNSNNLSFIVLRDAYGSMQCSVKKEAVSVQAWNTSISVYIESSIEVSGVIKKDERAPGGYELSASDIRFISQGEAFPITKDQSVEFLLDARHLWVRSSRLSRIMKVRHHTVQYLRDFLAREGFTEVVPPIISKSACEGGASLFPVHYFDTQAYLSQSGQLYSEALIPALEKVYVLAPAFRMEPSRTVRHLAEFWQLEPEMAFYDQQMNMEFAEKMTCSVIRRLAEENSELLEQLGRDIEALRKIKSPFPRMSYSDVIDFLGKKGLSVRYGDNLGADEETILMHEFDQPLFVHNYPTQLRSFYMREDPSNPGTVLEADLLAPEGHGEFIGSSERIWNYNELVGRIKSGGMNPDDYKWYLDLRKYGSVPHAGFGLGIERFVKWVLNLDHIRDAIPFPRTINRVYP